MSEILTALNEVHSSALLLLVVAALLAVAVFIYIAVIRQGRELRIGSLKLGPTAPDKPTASPDTPTASPDEQRPTSGGSAHFSRVLTSVTVLRWKRKIPNEKPFEQLTIPYLGKIYHVDIFDESVDFTIRTLKSGQSTKWHSRTESSGLVQFSAIAPQQVTIDEVSYHRLEGGRILAEIDTEGLEQVAYVTHRYNGFQSDQADFRIRQAECRIDEMVLHLNFERALGHCAFLALPEAFCEVGAAPRYSVPVESRHGTSWIARLVTKTTDERLVMRWRLTESLPQGPKYVFGYGSLMHPKSAAKSLPDLESQVTEFTPARLKNYRRSWSAISHNCSGARTEDGRITDSVAFMNIERAPGGSALGVLIPVSESELRALDSREEFYVRLDITKDVKVIDETHAEVVKEATIFTYITFCPIPTEQSEADIGIRADYDRLIQDASERIDEELGGLTLFQNDYARVGREVSEWPRVSVPEASDEGRYQY
ncbi:MAG: gamma-glutamylcyclotransferase [bacterium]|nr:gamma-glutamylcyclotransferase [bacterium]